MAAYWVLLARTLRRSLVGDIAFANAVAVPLSVLVDSGFSQYLIREYRVVGSVGLPPPLRRSVILRYLMIAATVVLITAVVFVVEDAQQRLLIGGFVALSYGLDSAGLVWLTRPRAQLDAVPYFWVRTVQGAGVVVFTLVLWDVGPYTAGSICALSAVVYVFGAVIALREWAHGPRWRVTSEEEVRLPVRPRRHFASFAILTTIYSRIDQIIVQVLLGPAALAIYALAFKLIETARIIPGAVARALLASASDGAASHGQRVIPRALFGTVRICTVIALTLAVSGPFMLRFLFGAQYASHGAAVLRLLALTLPGLGLTAPLSSLFLAWRAERTAAKNSLITLVVTAGSAVALAVPFGLSGVACGVVLGEIVSLGQYMHELTCFAKFHWSPTWADGAFVLLIAVSAFTCFALPPFAMLTMCIGVAAGGLGAALVMDGYSRVVSAPAGGDL
ncbi:MAG: lipopolysaccharide biosynthesis protein [Solirubrobacteraceae bacterium]